MLKNGNYNHSKYFLIFCFYWRGPNFMYCPGSTKSTLRLWGSFTSSWLCSSKKLSHLMWRKSPSACLEVSNVMLSIQSRLNVALFFFLFAKNMMDTNVYGIWFQQDCALCHDVREIIQFLLESFPGHIIFPFWWSKLTILSTKFSEGIKENIYKRVRMCQ